MGSADKSCEVFNDLDFSCFALSLCVALNGLGGVAKRGSGKFSFPFGVVTIVNSVEGSLLAGNILNMVVKAKEEPPRCNAVQIGDALVT